MGDLLRRRAMMAQTGGSPTPSGPLYPMADRTWSASSRTVETTGNHVEWSSAANSRGPAIGRAANASGTAVKQTWATWFSLAAGDVVDLWAKNLSYPAGSDTPYSNIRVQDGADNNVFSITDICRSADGTDLHSQTVIESAVEIKGILFWNYRPITASADIEIYVNGVRYV